MHAPTPISDSPADAPRSNFSSSRADHRGVRHRHHRVRPYGDAAHHCGWGERVHPIRGPIRKRLRRRGWCWCAIDDAAARALATLKSIEALMAIFTLGNLLSAIALATRAGCWREFITSLNHGAFFGTVPWSLRALVPHEKQASAVSMMFCV